MTLWQEVGTAVAVGWVLSVASYWLFWRLGWPGSRTADTPATWEQMQRTLSLQQANMASMARRLDEQQEEIDELRGENEAVREENARLRASQQALLNRFAGFQEGVERLIAQIEQAQMVPVWRPGTGPEPEPEPERPRLQRRDPQALATVARLIDECFSREEIDGLAFELGLDGKLTGETTEARASSLVLAASRRGILARLVELCRAQRPDGGF